MILHLPLFCVCYDYNFRKGKANRFVFVDGYMKTELGSLTSIKTGKLDANASSENGIYPFFTCAVEPLKIDSYSYDCECVLVAGNGDLNVKYYNGKFDAYQRTYIIESKDKSKLTVPYLYYFLESYIETLRSQSIGGIIKYIKIGNLTNASIPILSIEKQNKIVKTLDKAKSIITHLRTQLEKLDLLVKARFVEIFGDTEYNTKKFPVYKLSELCTVSSSKRIYQDEQSSTGVPFLRISNLVELIETGHLKNELFISDEKYIELVRSNLVPQKGDILVTSRGTLGKCYIVQDDDKFYFQDGMISWLYNLNKAITPLYLALLFNTRNIKTQIDNLQSGSTVAYLSITMLKKLNIVVPPLTLQNQFADFVKQIDKSKSILQQELDKAQMLFDSLMQEYFG